MLSPLVTYGQSPASSHLIVGTWSWTLFNGKCQETYSFRPDGTLLTTSAEAVTEWIYTITPQASSAGFYELVLVPARRNGKKDCSGDALEPGNAGVSSYIQLSPAKDRFISCKAQSLSACYGPLRRIE